METVRVQSMLDPYMTVCEYCRKTDALSKEEQELYGNDLPQAVTNFARVSIELTRHTNPDVVHCHDWMTYGAGVRAAHHHDKPLVAHIHATELDRTNFRPDEWIFELERQGLEAADQIIAVSKYTRSILAEHYGIDPGKIVVVHNGLSEEHLRPTGYTRSLYGPGQVPMVLFLGRVTLQKGPIQFLKMAIAVRELRPDVQFVMAGEGDMLDEVIQKADELGMRESITFTGRVTSAEARHLYATADCFVMPSLSEPFGLVALEAISHGTPVVISKQSGVSEVVSHVFKVDSWDTETMADCVLTILREKPLAQQLRTEAQRSVRHLCWDRQAQHVRSIYESLIT
ncbi:MAG: glycosyltransferase family 4 protein [Lentisphaerae bacterium]|nr:glycosyltransferase family 4 protein [Lentisphaerota bacterium]